jgi:hypothetical protein
MEPILITVYAYTNKRLGSANQLNHILSSFR